MPASLLEEGSALGPLVTAWQGIAIKISKYQGKPLAAPTQLVLQQISTSPGISHL